MFGSNDGSGISSEVVEKLVNKTSRSDLMVFFQLGGANIVVNAKQSHFYNGLHSVRSKLGDVFIK